MTGSQREEWEREYAEVRAYTTSYRRDVDRGVRLLRAWLEGRGGTIEGPVLECGCGTGRNLLPLAGAGLDVIGLDHARTALDEFRSRAREEGLGDRVRLEAHDLGEPLPLGDASVATCLDVTAIDNLVEEDRRRRYGDEVARVLRPGGHHLVVTFSRRDGYYRRWLPDDAPESASTGSRSALTAGETPGPVDPARLVVRDPHTGIRNQLFTDELLDASFPAALERRVAATLVFRDAAARERWTRVFLLRIHRRIRG